MKRKPVLWLPRTNKAPGTANTGGLLFVLTALEEQTVKPLAQEVGYYLQRRRPPPAAETGRSCWGRGLQDASAAQGTKQMQGAATRAD